VAVYLRDVVDLGADMSWRCGDGWHSSGCTNVDHVTRSDLPIPSERRRKGRDTDVHRNDRRGRMSTELSCLVVIRILKNAGTRSQDSRYLLRLQGGKTQSVLAMGFIDGLPEYWISVAVRP
jgi:hypothetical protein